MAYNNFIITILYVITELLQLCYAIICYNMLQLCYATQLCYVITGLYIITELLYAYGKHSFIHLMLYCQHHRRRTDIGGVLTTILDIWFRHSKGWIWFDGVDVIPTPACATHWPNCGMYV